MADTRSPEAVRRGRLKLLALAVFFALPVVGGWLAYLFDWTPHSPGNYGELIAPRTVPDATLLAVDGGEMRFSALRGRWILVAFDRSACDAYCERKLYLMRQLRRTQGANMGRIERAWVLTDAGVPQPRVLNAIKGTYVVRPAAAGFVAAFPAGRSVTDHIYLVDPRGNIMMRYPRDPDPARMIQDLKRLMKYSTIG